MARSTSFDTQSSSGSIFDIRQVGTSPVERWYASGISGNTTAGDLSETVDLNTLWAVPFYVGSYNKINAVRINIKTQAVTPNSKLRMGVYANTDSGTIYPSSLIVDAGEVDSTVSGFSVKTVSVELPSNDLVWFILNCSVSSPAVRAIDGGILTTMFGYDSLETGNQQQGNIKVASTYGALPATFPAGGTSSVGLIHQMSVRFA